MISSGVAEKLYTRWAGIKRWKRILLRCVLLFVVWAGIHFPNPVEVVTHLLHIANPEALIRPDLPDMERINRDVDAMIAESNGKLSEVRAVERYVLRNIHYKFDWESGWNLDYWPDAADVWQRRADDCDGRAVLAVSILRARGRKDARLAGNLIHIWAQTGSDEFMGPHKEKSIRVTEKTITTPDGKKVTKKEYHVTPPSVKMLLRGFSFHMRHFPMTRLILLFVLSYFAVCWTGRNSNGIIGGLVLLLGGMLYFTEWAELRKPEITAAFVAGALLTLLALILPLIIRRREETS